jgi:hypothetical protein
MVLYRDAAGNETSFEVPNISKGASFAEAPDGSVWTLTDSELIRIRAEAGRLSIVERYPVNVLDADRVFCDREGRVWMVHTTVPNLTGMPESRNGESAVYTELIRFATRP